MDTAGSTVRKPLNGAGQFGHRGVDAATRTFALLTAAEAMDLWPAIASHILLDMVPLASREPWSEERLMTAVVRGHLEVWLYTEGARVLAVVTTTMTADGITGAQALLIYSASGMERLGDADWRTMFAQVSRYARVAGAAKIVAFTSVPRVLQIVNDLGGSTVQVLCELPILEGKEL